MAKSRLLPETYDIERLKEFKASFIAELTAALKGQENSIAAIPNYLPPTSLVKPGDTFQVLVIGGSVLRNALMESDFPVPSVISSTETSLPTLETKEQLFDILLLELHPDAEILALNFAYPFAANIRENRLDGTVVRGTKSHQLKGLIGKTLGQELEAYIKEKTKRQITVTAANDALCLLLSAIHRNTDDNLIGGIIGTGTNYAIIQDNQVYNLESGNFDKFSMTRTGQIIDEKSNNQGQQHFEKEVSGGYLYQHYNTFVEIHNLPIKTLKSTVQLSYLAESPHATHEQEIARRLLERSARLTGAKIAALLEFKSKDFTSIIMEGSLFWEGWNYVKTVEDTIEKLGHDLNTFEWIHIPDSSVIGAGNLVQTVDS